MCNWPPVSITTDKLGSYPKALRRLKRKGELKDTVQHRTSRYLNNRIEADHGALKRLIRPTRGFQSMKTAYATIKGFEVMRMIRRRHCILIEPGVTGEVRFVQQTLQSRRLIRAAERARFYPTAVSATKPTPVRDNTQWQRARAQGHLV